MKKKFLSALSLLLVALFLFAGCTTVPETIPADTVQAATAADYAVIVDAAYALEPGESLPEEQTLTGTVTKIITRYSSKYENITVLITVPGREDRPIQCFRLEGPGADCLGVGDTVTVVGLLSNYNGTVEFEAGCYLDFFIKSNDPPEETVLADSDNDDSKEAVALYIHTHGCLPDFYMTKTEARNAYGWEGGALDNLAPGMCIGGDEFRNYEGQLPDAPGRRYTECDINTIGAGARGAERIVFSNDGLVFYTADHYDTFELLYGEE